MITNVRIRGNRKSRRRWLRTDDAMPNLLRDATIPDGAEFLPSELVMTSSRPHLNKIEENGKRGVLIRRQIHVYGGQISIGRRRTPLPLTTGATTTRTWVIPLLNIVVFISKALGAR